MSDKRSRRGLKLGTIAQEEKLCRAAFKDIPIGTAVFHCHHEILVEFLSEPPEVRIDYILNYKLKDEQALRLRLFRPIKSEQAGADWQKAYADWQKADADWQKADADWRKVGADWHNNICKNCPWNGSTIFP